MFNMNTHSVTVRKEQGLLYTYEEEQRYTMIEKQVLIKHWAILQRLEGLGSLVGLLLAANKCWFLMILTFALDKPKVI